MVAGSLAERGVPVHEPVRTASRGAIRAALRLVSLSARYATRRTAWPGVTRSPGRNSRTRIPKTLHRQLKLYCVTHEIAVQGFVVEAIEERLKSGRKRGRAAS